MKIISKFKDYYDFIAHQYGVDSSIIYKRDILPNEITENQFINLSSIKVEEFWKCEGDYFNVRWIIICGKSFPVYSSLENNTYKFVTKSAYSEITRYKRKDNKYFSYMNNYETWYMNDQSTYNNLVECHKLLNTPIFEIKRINRDPSKWCAERYKDITFNTSPNLSILGIPTVYPAEQIYMDITYFISNIMKDTPDIKPPVEIHDKHKLISHGFDKHSFKHRK
jgi:hypothetical protein